MSQLLLLAFAGYVFGIIRDPNSPVYGCIQIDKDPPPVIGTIRDNDDDIRVLSPSDYTTITRWGLPQRHAQSAGIMSMNAARSN